MVISVTDATFVAEQERDQTLTLLARSAQVVPHLTYVGVRAVEAVMRQAECRLPQHCNRCIGAHRALPAILRCYLHISRLEYE